MYAVARSNRAMRSAQIAYDNAEPPEEVTPWLETAEGANWLHGTALDLRHGRDFKLDGKVKVSHRDFLLEFAPVAAELMAADTDFELEQDLAAGRPPRTERFEKLAQEVAERLVAPHAAEAEQELLMEMF
ncbi:MAG TPA: hypothetical protein VL178_04430 [Pseudomonas sp.]|nr:hypothetical protein [Pseudomonas sp.]